MRVLLLAPLALIAVDLGAQEWNSERTLELVTRAAITRGAMLGDAGLSDYRAHARGFVFFMAQTGLELDAEPQIVKIDQLALEVYWKSPDLSKQRILGWRDHVELPTEIRYHRDHLGIVQNNFGDLIRLGDGTEARDVIHPLSADGPSHYDYRITDSLRIDLPYEVLVRPKDLAAAAIVGSVYLDTEAAAVVRFRFSFTPNSYLDDNLEDITILLDHALVESRFWLPRRQEIEIRRRSAVFDIPVRGIIRGRWEVTDYELNVGIPDSVFGGLEIVVADSARRAVHSWEGTLQEELRRFDDDVEFVDLAAVRDRAMQIAGAGFLSGLPSLQLGFGSISEILQYNRVRGLAAGASWRFDLPHVPVTLRLAGNYGTGDRRFTGSAAVSYRRGSYSVELRAARRIRDISDVQVMSPLVRSFAAQELGRDYGDYYLEDEITLLVGNRTFSLSAGLERTASVDALATPASGRLRPNPRIGGGRYGVAGLTVNSQMGGFGRRMLVDVRLSFEAGWADAGRYVRAQLSTAAKGGFAGTIARLHGWVGGGTADLPQHRLFVVGGWGSLPGEPFRQYGGTRAGAVAVEWGRRFSFRPLPLGGTAAAPVDVFVGPILRIEGAGGRGLPGVWGPSGRLRIGIGLVAEPLGGLVRLELVRNLAADSWGATADFGRMLWTIL
ncbi:MAG: hypothetical protein ACE5FJ_00775 [Gemmatimonadales bacterium]